jgi:hypothetical protein
MHVGLSHSVIRSAGHPPVTRTINALPYGVREPEALPMWAGNDEVRHTMLTHAANDPGQGNRGVPRGRGWSSVGDCRLMGSTGIWCLVVAFLGVHVLTATGFAGPLALNAASEETPKSAGENATRDAATALALRTAELALKEAQAASDRKDETGMRTAAAEARQALLPLIKRSDQRLMEVWRTAGTIALLLQDVPMAAAVLEAIQRLRPDFAEEEDLLELLARLNRMPVQPYLAAMERDRAAYLDALGTGPTSGLPYENSLGMRFVPVAGTDVLFSIWETRVQDYRAYANANPDVDKSWENPVFGGVQVTPGPDHPVVNVSWTDAKAFCEWLTRKGQQEGRLGKHQFYRLPTDREWSVAVGLEREAGETPEARDAMVPNVYPWGQEWPPPAGAGNYADLTAKASFPSWEIIESYRDGFATTAPVGSFPANPFGLYDLGGNVWEWCEDRYHPEKEFRVVRGGSWFNSDPRDLLSSARDHHLPGYRYDCYGFRIVLVSRAESR